MENQPYDPTGKTIKIRGNAEYLPVRERVAWLRSEHPDAGITTEAWAIDSANAIFRAEIKLPTGGSSTGWGSETPDDFRDYIEKAETKALGRALAGLGYGTAALDEGAIVDAPVPERQSSRQSPTPNAAQTPKTDPGGTQAVNPTAPLPGQLSARADESGASQGASVPTQTTAASAPKESSPSSPPITEAQIKKVYVEAKKLEIDADSLAFNDAVALQFGAPFKQLTLDQARALIDMMIQNPAGLDASTLPKEAVLGGVAAVYWVHRIETASSKEEADAIRLAVKGRYAQMTKDAIEAMTAALARWGIGPGAEGGS